MNRREPLPPQSSQPTKRMDQSREKIRSPITLGFVARAAGVVILIWAIANTLWLGRELLFVAFFATLVAAFLSVFVDRLEKLGAPRSVAALTVMVLALGLLAGIWALSWPALQDQIALVREELPAAAADFGVWLQDQYDAVTGEFGDAAMWAELQERVSHQLTGVLAGALPLLNTAAGAVAGALIVLFAGLYLSIEPRLYTDGVLRLVPPASRPRARRTLLAAGSAIRRWMLGTAINMVAVGLATTLGLWLLDVPAAVGLGLIAAVLEFIPIVGPILAAIPALAIALIVSPTLALYVLILYIVIQQLESNVLMPLVMKGAVELPPALTVLFQALMAIIFGFLGLLLAVPMLAAGLVIVQQLYIDTIESTAQADPEPEPEAEAEAA
jgi:predicted PurR-regulated permease PerM